MGRRIRMGQEWEIQLTERAKVADAHDGLVVLEWKLNRAPEQDWVKYFISGPGHKSGTADFISRAPEVQGSKVRFTVLEADLENAVRRVEASIAGANQTFDTYVMEPRRRREAGKRTEAVERERRIQAAQERLDRLDS
jgi:hypothetical protein